MAPLAKFCFSILAVKLSQWFMMVLIVEVYRDNGKKVETTRL